MHLIERQDFDTLFKALEGDGYTVIGPTYRDGSIILDQVSSSSQLPRGWTDVQEAASYDTVSTGRETLFEFVVGPNSWKRWLFPPRLRLFAAKKEGKRFDVEAPDESSDGKYAFLGVRSCELHAIAIQDKIFMQGEYADSHYRARREKSLLIAVNCLTPSGTCFCASMETGPRALGGFDLALTEVYEEGRHVFLVETGSARGEEILGKTVHREADEADSALVDRLMGEAARKMYRAMDTTNLQELLNKNFDHPHWDNVARRCLSCANCTLVCPTCFCSTVEDVTDLTGGRAERWRRWDSCFTSDFTKVAGGNVRMSARSRYRQWLTHKLANWIDQFGTRGCVGCGRCITWCPVGIDLTVEVEAFRK